MKILFLNIKVLWIKFKNIILGNEIKASKKNLDHIKEKPQGAYEYYKEQKIKDCLKLKLTPSPIPKIVKKTHLVPSQSRSGFSAKGYFYEF